MHVSALSGSDGVTALTSVIEVWGACSFALRLVVRS